MKSQFRGSAALLQILVALGFVGPARAGPTTPPAEMRAATDKTDWPAVLNLLAGPAATGDNAADLFRHGVANLETGANKKQAYADLEKALKVDPANESVALWLARAAAVTAPQRWGVHILIGKALTRLGRHEAAATTFGAEDYRLAAFAFQSSQEVDGGVLSRYWSGRTAYALAREGRDRRRHPLLRGSRPAWRRAYGDYGSAIRSRPLFPLRADGQGIACQPRS